MFDHQVSSGELRLYLVKCQRTLVRVSMVRVTGW
jgi:hypothetical protein